MKKLRSLVFAGIAVFTFSGCGGTSGDGGGDDGSGELYTTVDIEHLYQGYGMTGYSDDMEDVTLVYCGGQYDYYRGSEHFYGDFNIVDDEIQMYDHDGGSYIIDTDNYFLEVGEYYYIFDINSDITVESIYAISC